MSHCSPDRETSFKKNKSCLNLKELQQVATRYNTKQLQGSQIPTSKMKTIKSIIPALQSALCSSNSSNSHSHSSAAKTVKTVNTVKTVKTVDKCVLSAKHDLDLNSSLTERFRPEQPSSWKKNKNEWLSSRDIENVMKQYEKAYKNFQFLGVYSIDFAAPLDNTNVCVSRQMCKFMDDLSKKTLNKSIKRFAVVFNLDTHDGPGSHWVSMYCDLRPTSKKYGAFYYDSVGDKHPKEVSRFFQYIKSYVQDDNFKLAYNKKQQQFQNSECGVFSMAFIIQCLQEQSKSYIQCIDNIPVDKQDSKINNLRNILFM